MQSPTVAAIAWPSISFGPVNLWSLHPAWSRDTAPLQAKTPAAKIVKSVARRENPLFLQALAHR